MGLSRQQWRVFIAAAAMNALVFLDQTSVTVALPSIQQDLDSTRSVAEWIIGAYLLPMAAFIAVSGRLGDIFGRRRLFVAGVTVFGLGSIQCAVAPDAVVLLSGRVVQGVGAAVAVPLALALATSALPRERRGWAIGWFATIGTTFLSVGPLLGGFLVEVASWRWIFLINLPIVILAITYSLRYMSESRPKRDEHVDVPGLLLLTVGISLVCLAIERSVEWGIGGRTLSCFGVGLLALGAFVAVETRVKQPLIELRLLARPTVAGALFALLAIQFSVMGLTVFLPFYLQQVLGYGALVAGALFLPTVIWTPLLSPTTGRLADRRGPRRLIIAGLIISTLGLVAIALIVNRKDLALLMIAFALFGLGRPFAFTPSNTAALGAIPAAARGLASGLAYEARQIGAVLGVFGMGAVISAVELAERNRLLAGSDANFGPNRRAALDSVLSGGATGHHTLALLSPADAAQVRTAASQAFDTGLQTAVLVLAGLMAVASVVAILTIERRGVAKKSEVAAPARA